MIRRNIILTVMAAVTLLAAGQPAARRRIATSARNFEQRFEDLKGAGDALTPFERFVFSLALAGASDEPVK